MVTFVDRELLPLEQFVLAWRITNAKWDHLPEQALNRIFALTPEGVGRVAAMAKEFRSETYPLLPKAALWQVKTPFSFEEESPEDTTRINRWLSALPIASDEQVYIHWATHRAAIMTDWATFQAYWNSFVYPFDAVTLFDDSLDWALLLGQEERAWFLSKRS